MPSESIFGFARDANKRGAEANLFAFCRGRGASVRPKRAGTGARAIPGTEFVPCGGMKLLFVSLGWLALSVGVVGIFVPFVPTTPLVLLAGALWVRSSPRLHAWLLRQPGLGRCLSRYQERRALPRRAKAAMVASVWFSLGYLAFGVLGASPWLRVAPLLLAGAITVCILRIPGERGKAGSEK